MEPFSSSAVRETSNQIFNMILLIFGEKGFKRDFFENKKTVPHTRKFLMVNINW